MKKRRNAYITGVVTLFIIMGIGLYQYNVQGPQEYGISNKPVLSKVSNFPQDIQTYDSEGHPQVMTFYSKPTRVIVSERNSLETILSLGEGDCVINTSLQKNSQAYKELSNKYPDEIKKVHFLGAAELNTESSLAQRPDFILGWKSTFTSVFRKSTHWWNSRGIKTYVVATSNHLLSKGTIADECKFLDDMGRIFSHKDKTDQMIKEIHQELDSVKSETEDREKQVVMVIEKNRNGFFNYDSGWLVGDMVQQLGGYMPVKERTVSSEELIKLDPDVIFVVYFSDEMKQDIYETFSSPMYNSLKVVKNNRIYPISLYDMYATGVRTVNGIQLIRNGLYPDLCSE